MLTFICYPKCTTCQKAKALLDSYQAQYEIRDIKTDSPSYDELKYWHTLSGLPVKKFFNTSGQLYRSLGLKDKLPSMSEDECLRDSAHIFRRNGAKTSLRISRGTYAVFARTRLQIWACIPNRYRRLT